MLADPTTFYRPSSATPTQTIPQPAATQAGSSSQNVIIASAPPDPALVHANLKSALLSQDDLETFSAHLVSNPPTRRIRNHNAQGELVEAIRS